MRVVIVIIFQVFCACVMLHAQNTFSRVVEYGETINRATAVASDSSGIYIVGRAQKLPSYTSPIHITCFSHTGDVLWNTIFTIDSAHINLYYERHIELTSSSLVFHFTPKSGIDRASRTIVLDKDTGELQEEHVFDRYFDGAWVNFALDFDINGESDLAIAQYSLDLASEKARFEVLIIKDDLDTARYSLHDEDLWTVAEQVEWINDSILIVAGIQYSLHSWEDLNRTNKILLRKLNDSGDLLWSFSSRIFDSRDTLISGVNEVIYNSDNTILIATSERIRESRYPDRFTVGRPLIVKIDEFGEEVWSSNLEFDTYSASSNRPDAMIRSSDDNAYIIAGTYDSRNDRYELIDSIDYERSAYIVKLSEDGNVIWKRFFRHPHPDLSAIHILNDAAVAEDNGYLMTGGFSLMDTVFQTDVVWSSWLIKLDEYGCLIPGCQEIPTSLEENRVLENILIYPNPASNQIYIYQSHDGKLNYDLLSSQGKVLRKFKISTASTNYILDINTLPIGHYFLRISDENSKEQLVKKIIVQR